MTHLAGMIRVKAEWPDETRGQSVCTCDGQRTSRVWWIDDLATKIHELTFTGNIVISPCRYKSHVRAN